MKIQIDLEKLRKSGLFIGIPMYSGICNGSTTAGLMQLVHLLVEHQIPYKRFFLFNESLIPRARNYVADEFLRDEDCQTMIFIDADVGFDARDVLAMMHLQLENKYDILCAPYPKKTIAFEKVRDAVNAGVADENPKELEKYVGDYVFSPLSGQFKISEPVEVRESGTGFMMISKDTLNKFKDSYPEYMYTPDHARTENFDGSRDICQFFHCEIDPKSNRYLSEDYWFCQKAKDVGLSTWLCPWIKLTHTGSYVFKGDLGAIASINQSVNYRKS